MECAGINFVLKTYYGIRVTTAFVNTLWPRVTLSAISVCMYYIVSNSGDNYPVPLVTPLVTGTILRSPYGVCVVSNKHGNVLGIVTVLYDML